MTKERADLGFADALDDFDPADWLPRAERGNDKPPKGETKKAAAAAGFRSREPQPVPKDQPAAPPAPAVAAPATVSQPLVPRGRRTGRNAQFNLKARPDTVAAFCAVADRQGWGLGETLERAVALLEREYMRGSGLADGAADRSGRRDGAACS